MTRTSGLLLGTLVLAAAGVTAVNFGFAEPYVSASAVPLQQPVALAATFVLVFVAALLNAVVNTRVWRSMGRDLGLTPGGGINVFAKHDLTGEVDGRPVRVHTYSRGGGGQHRSRRKYTVVEADLDAPVEWSAIVGPADGHPNELGTAGGAVPDIGSGAESLAELPEMGDTRTVTVQNGVAVWGDLSAAQGDTLLTPRLERAVTALGGGVAVGDAAGAMVEAMRETLDGAEGLAAGLADNVLDTAESDRGPRAGTTVSHEQRGVLLDDATLKRRVEAVVAAAEAAKSADTGA